MVKFTVNVKRAVFEVTTQDMSEMSVNLEVQEDILKHVVVYTRYNRPFKGCLFWK